MKIIFLMFIKTRPTSKIPIARLARDPNIGGYTRRDRHAITTRLFAFLCHVRTASLVTAFTNVFLCHRTCNIYDHMVKTCDFSI